MKKWGRQGKERRVKVMGVCECVKMQFPALGLCFSWDSECGIKLKAS